MENSFNILFYIKRVKVDKLGKANIYLRITVNGRRAELSVRRKYFVDKWSSETGRAIGYNPEAKEINQYIDSIQHKLYKIYQYYIDKNIPYTAEKIKDHYLGKDSSLKMILAIFEEHNVQVNALVGKDFAAGTAERYKTAKKHVSDYIQLEYKVDDLPVKDIDHQFITGFEYYLKTKRNCGHNSAVKYITNFKKIVRIAYANNWITKDPFFNWKSRLKVVDREFLSEQEIQAIIEKDFRNKRLDQVKDIFVFCCFTGLAYADVKKLNENDVVIGIDGEQWIKTKRTKTDTRSNIPILPTAAAILEKYAEHPVVLNENKLLPVLSNQKMNAYLKEIADVCNITKNLTFHLARHTFATTVTLTNGVPIESVSKMLGHKSLKTTQHYAKILDKKVSADMQALKFILNKTQEKNKLNKSDSTSSA